MHAEFSASREFSMGRRSRLPFYPKTLKEFYMQKKIIALAIAAAFSAPAFADVNVYGILDFGYASTSKTLTPSAGASSKFTQSALGFNTITSSRLGFLATDDLGNGMKAVAKIESGIGSNPLAGVVQTGINAAAFNGTTIDATSLGSRELNVGLMFASGTTVSGGFGSTLVRDITFAYDAAPGGNLVGNALSNDVSLANNRVTSVTVAQAFGPLKGTVSLSHNTDSAVPASGATPTDTQKSNGYLLGLQFNQGPASAAFAYQNLKSVNPAAAAPAVLTTVGETQKIAILAGSFDLGVAKLFGEYANIKNNDSFGPLVILAPSNGNATAGDGKRTYESVGVDVPFGAVMGFVQLSHGSINVVTATNVASASRSISGYTLGAKYSMSKFTYGYAELGQTKLNSAAGANTGIKASQYSLGLVRSF
jgi:predicted porin